MTDSGPVSTDRIEDAEGADPDAAGSDASDGGSREYCPECDRETLHAVAVEMCETATDGIADRNRKFARCPARVRTCPACGTERRSFVNR